MLRIFKFGEIYDYIEKVLKYLFNVVIYFTDCFRNDSFILLISHHGMCFA